MVDREVGEESVWEPGQGTAMDREATADRA